MRDGTPARFVGGCVRDALLDPLAEAADLDLATPEPPERVIALARWAGLKALPTGLAHGTVTILAAARRYEVTTLRRDVRTNGRHAEVAFTDDFEEDAARRDFTINAMSCDPAGRVYDYFGGRVDLAAGRIRFVGDPATRIAEDYLRILRFFRFFARFGRPPADPDALAACAAAAPQLHRLSGERVRQELFRLLAAERSPEALRLMREIGVLAHLLPARDDLGPLRRLIAAWPESDPVLRLAALLPSADAVETIATRLRLSNREHQRLGELLRLPYPDPAASRPEHRRAFFALGTDLHLDRLRLAVAESAADPGALARVEELAATWTSPRMPLNGDDLIARGLSPGPQLGALLAAFRSWWEAHDYQPDRAAALAWLDERVRTRDEGG
jgi:poly(A) polymerase